MFCLTQRHSRGRFRGHLKNKPAHRLHVNTMAAYTAEGNTATPPTSDEQQHPIYSKCLALMIKTISVHYHWVLFQTLPKQRQTEGVIHNHGVMKKKRFCSFVFTLANNNTWYIVLSKGHLWLLLSLYQRNIFVLLNTGGYYSSALSGTQQGCFSVSLSLSHSQYSSRFTLTSSHQERRPHMWHTFLQHLWCGLKNWLTLSKQW